MGLFRCTNCSWSLGFFFPRTFIFAGDIIAIIFPCRKALKPHLGSASCCVRYCSSGVPAPASLKAKGSSQTEGGKGRRGLGEVGVAQRLCRTRPPQPAPPVPEQSLRPRTELSSSYTFQKSPAQLFCRWTGPPGSKPSCRASHQ